MGDVSLQEIELCPAGPSMAPQPLDVAPSGEQTLGESALRSASSDLELCHVETRRLSPSSSPQTSVLQPLTDSVVESTAMLSPSVLDPAEILPPASRTHLAASTLSEPNSRGVTAISAMQGYTLPPSVVTRLCDAQMNEVDSKELLHYLCCRQNSAMLEWAALMGKTSDAPSVSSNKAWTAQQVLEQHLRQSKSDTESSTYHYNVMTKEFFEGMFLRACVRPHDMLDRLLLSLKSKASMAVVFQSLNAHVAAFLWLCLVAIAALLVVSSVTSAMFFERVNTTDYTKLRFTMMSRVDGIRLGPSLNRFLSLQGPECCSNGCSSSHSEGLQPSRPGHTVLELADFTAEVQFDDLSPIVGWQIDPESGTEGAAELIVKYSDLRSPVFNIEAWDGQTWQGVGSGHYIATFFGTVVPLATSCGANGCSAILGVSWVFLIDSTCVFALMALFCICAALFGVLGKSDSMMTSARIGWLQCAILQGFAVLASIANSNSTFAISRLIGALCMLRVYYVIGSSKTLKSTLWDVVAAESVYVLSVALDRVGRGVLNSILETGEVFVLLALAGVLGLMALHERRKDRALKMTQAGYADDFRSAWHPIYMEENSKDKYVWARLSRLTSSPVEPLGLCKQQYRQLDEVPVSMNPASSFERSSSCEDPYLHSSPGKKTRIRKASWISFNWFQRPEIEVDGSRDYHNSSFGSSLHRLSSRLGTQLSLVESVDQLYLLAASVYPIHLEKTKELAVQSNGWFANRQVGDMQVSRIDSAFETMPSDSNTAQPHIRVTVSSTPEKSNFVRSVDLGQRPNQQLAVFSPMKSFARSLTKIHEVYGGEVARLCDIVRQEILFDSVHDLCQCLEALKSDQEIFVLSIKDTMTRDDAAQESGGVRHVKINFRISNKVTRGLGVDFHVTELILSLKSMHQVKQTVRAEEYHAFRSARTNRAGLLLTTLRLFGSFGARQRLRLTSVAGAGRTDDDEVLSGDTILDQLAPCGQGGHSLLFRTIVLHHLWHLRIPAGRMSAQARKAWDAFADSDSGSVFLMQNPLLGLWCKWRSLILVSLISVVYFLGYTVGNFSAYSSGFSQKASSFRFTVLETRSGRNHSSVSLHEFGLSHFGCRVPCTLNCTSTAIGSQMEIHFDQEVSFNGWYLTTSTVHNPELDPIIFQLEAQKTPDSGWQTVGSSSSIQMRINDFAHRLEPFDMPRERGKVAEFSLGPQWQWFLVYAGISVNIMFFFPAQHLAFWRQDLDTLHFNTWYSALMITSISMIAMIGHMAERHTFLVSQHDLVSMLFWGTYGYITFRMKDKYLIDAVLAMCPFYVVRVALLERYVRGTTEWTEMIDSSQLAIVFVVILIKLIQMYTIYKSQWTGHSMKLSYNKLWQDLISDENEKSSLDELQAVVKTVDSLPSRSIKQRGFHWHCIHETQGYMDPSFWSASHFTDVPGLQDLGPSITCLDQLWAQAQALYILLQDKVGQWGHRNKAMEWCSDARGTHVYVPHAAESPGAKKGRVSIKSSRRIMQKLYRCYGNSKSSILDICRGALVLETSEAMTWTLKDLLEDPDIRVLRVKNSMDPAHPGGELGYRHVLLNLQLTTPMAERLGVSTHVAELQLIHVSFARLKASSGHDTYKIYRDLRGS